MSAVKVNTNIKTQKHIRLIDIKQFTQTMKYVYQYSFDYQAFINEKEIAFETIAENDEVITENSDSICFN